MSLRHLNNGTVNFDVKDCFCIFDDMSINKIVWSLIMAETVWLEVLN